MIFSHCPVGCRSHVLHTAVRRLSLGVRRRSAVSAVPQRSAQMGDSLQSCLSSIFQHVSRVSSRRAGRYSAFTLLQYTSSRFYFHGGSVVSVKVKTYVIKRMIENWCILTYAVRYHFLQRVSIASMQSAVLAMRFCPSDLPTVRLSHSGFMPKPLMTGSYRLHWRIAPWL